MAQFLIRFSLLAFVSLLCVACGSSTGSDPGTNDTSTNDNNSIPYFNFETAGITDIYQPGAGYDGSRFLVVFYGQGASGFEIFGTFISEDGTQSDVFSIVDSSIYLGGGVTGPVVAFDGTNYLIVYTRQSRVYGIRVLPDGTVLDTNGGFLISNIVIDEEDVAQSVACDGTNCLVVWQKGHYLTGNRIRGALVSKSGVPESEFNIESDPASTSSSPAISFDGTTYLVSWVDGRNTGNTVAHVYAARVTQAGVVLDPEGFPVTETSASHFSVRSTFDGTNHNVSWMSTYIIDPIVYYVNYTKRIAPDGFIVDGPTTYEGNELATVTVGGRIVIGGENQFVAWYQGTSQGGINIAANAVTVSLAVWADDSVTLRGSFIYK